MNATKIVVAVMLFLSVVFAFAWVSQGSDFFLYKVFAPKYEQVRRETYEQTKSYRQGSIQRLSELCKQVAEADEGHKPMLYDVVSHEFAEWNDDDVPAYLHSCLTLARAH